MSAGAMPPRVDVVIGGAQKAGTTALDKALRAHPAMRMPSMKEPHFFDNDVLFANGVPDFDTYHAMWREGLGTRLCCDSTPSYLWWPSAPQRLRDYNHALRWVILLRDPAERAYSHWNMVRNNGFEALPFADALDAEVSRLAAGLRRDRFRHSYVSRGFYARQLARLFTLFPRDQVLVLRSDQLRKDFAATVATVVEFLGLEPFETIEPITAHQGNYAAPLAPEQRAALVRRFDEDIRELESLLGWELSDWRR
ncbi:MAG: sulfotransferase domain-containing protein [Betaproteobacteria bacterium]